jgi:hypothetical protein
MSCWFLFYFVEICPRVGLGGFLYDDVLLTMACIFWGFVGDFDF